jgi:hypothetical protein
VTEQQPARRRNVGRVLAHIAVVIGILAIAAAAFVLSYRAARDIALAAGVPAVLARLYPGILDAVFLVACAAAVTLREARWWTRGYAWLSVLVTGALIGAADVYHAMSLQLPQKAAAGIVAALPLALVVLGFSLWLSMLRHGRTAGVPAPGPGPLVQAGPELVQAGPETALAIEAGPSAVGPGPGARPALPAPAASPTGPDAAAEPATVNKPDAAAEPATVNKPDAAAEPAAVNEPSVASGVDPDQPSVTEAAAEPPAAAETGFEPTAPALAADDNPGPAVPTPEAEPMAEAEPTPAAPQPTAEPQPESAADTQRDSESRPEAAQPAPAGPERVPVYTAASDPLTPPFGFPVAAFPDSDLSEGAAGTPVRAAEPARDATQPRPSSDRAADVPTPALAVPVPTFLSAPVPESTGPLPAPVAPGPGDAQAAEATPVPEAAPGLKAVSASETGATPESGATPEAAAAARGKPPSAGSLPAPPAELAHETAPAADRPTMRGAEAPEKPPRPAGPPVRFERFRSTPTPPDN